MEGKGCDRYFVQVCDALIGITSAGESFRMSSEVLTPEEVEGTAVGSGLG